MNEKKNGDITDSKDIIVIDRILNKGEKQLFSELIEKYKSLVFNLALRMTKNYSESEELTQEIFVKVYSKLEDYKVRYKFRDWLYAIASNTITDRLRKRKFAFFSIDKPIKTEKKDVYFDFVDIKQTDPEAGLLEKEEKDKILNLVSGLPVNYKAVIVLRYFEKLSYEEIAKISKLSLGTVKTRLHRAQKMLQKKIKLNK